MELTLICRRFLSDCEKHGPRLWRECVIPWIGVGDFDLFARLLNKNGTSGEKFLLSELKKISDCRGWDRKLLVSLGVDRILENRDGSANRRQSGPPRFLIPAWAGGMVNYCPGFGVAVSSAAFWLLGRHHEIEHRIWRAQSALILPLLDRIRLDMCEYLISAHGQDWATDWLQPIDRNEAERVEKSPHACQFGHMETVINSNSKLIGVKQKFGRLIYEFRQIRNDLSHSRSIAYWKFKKFFEDKHEFDKLP